MNTKETAVGQAGFFTEGKVDIGFEIQKDYVAGVCLAYQSRNDQEHEYMIREKSFVMIGERNLSECVEEAKDLAYRAVISRLQLAGNLAASPQSAVQAAPVVQAAPSPASVSVEMEKSGDSSVEEKPVTAPVAQAVHQPYTPPDDEEDQDDDSGYDDPQDEDGDDDEDGGEDDSGDVSDFEDGDGEDNEQTQGNGIQRLDLNLGLQPASSLPNPTASAQKPALADDADVEMKKALAMPITILGKLHASYGKTVAEILDTDPQCIVDFAHRYKGPKEDEKNALVKLYSEAVRRVQNAA
jgi:hypothetical protein